MQKVSKWSDDEDDQDFEMRQKQVSGGLSLPSKLIEETNIFREKAFLGWAKGKAKSKSNQNQKLETEKSRIGKLLAQEQQGNAKYQNKFIARVKPLSQIMKKDSLKCAVKTIDFLPTKTASDKVTWLYAGVGKVLRICTLDVRAREYKLEQSFYFQNENILKSRFLDSSTVVSHLLKKKHISLFDLQKERSTKLLKLFSEGISNNKRIQAKSRHFVDCMDVDGQRKYVGVCSSNLFSLVDRRSRRPALQKNLMKKVVNLRFSGATSVVYQTNAGLFKLDLR